jgi:hypothetical protein
MSSEIVNIKRKLDDVRLDGVMELCLALINHRAQASNLNDSCVQFVLSLVHTGTATLSVKWQKAYSVILRALIKQSCNARLQIIGLDLFQHLYLPLK